MAGAQPLTTLDRDYSDTESNATPWSDAQQYLAGAGISWLSTVRPDGRPHVTPLITIWLDGALYFSTGPDERKAHNLETNRHVVLTTGTNDANNGLDLVVEGEAVPVTDQAELRPAADAWIAKYGEFWRYDVVDGGFRHPRTGGSVLVFRVSPRVGFGFGRSKSSGTGGFSQTRWEFER
jgi:nitroimidazol reductase NimA-like FMN-containing flavoprotein (pyridoxamine 5'-phosphate oxidase superfamily)